MANKDATFLDAVKDVNPLKVKSKTIHSTPTKPKPIPRKFIEDESKALLDNSFLRSGHSPDIIKRLKKGYWTVEGSIDLHGLVSEEAKEYVVEFIQECKRKGVRCIRIIHGKGYGSFNKEPVLKKKVRNWLSQKDEVIAFAEAPKHDGGSGVVIVLLKSGN